MRYNTLQPSPPHLGRLCQFPFKAIPAQALEEHGLPARRARGDVLNVLQPLGHVTEPLPRVRGLALGLRHEDKAPVERVLLVLMFVSVLALTRATV